MNKYFKKNQKKILAIFSAGLMVAFALPSMTSNSSRGQATVGTIDHGKVMITGREYNNCHNEWQALKHQFGGRAIAAVLAGIDRIDETLVVKVLGDPQVTQKIEMLESYAQQNPMFYRILSQQDPETGALADASRAGMPVFVQIENNDELFVLLVKEAQQMGVGVSNDLVDSILQARGLTRDADPELYETLEMSLRSLLMVNNAAARAASVVKVSQPELHNLLATQRQQLSLDLVEFNYKDYLDKIAAPTPEQLTEQFNKYKADEADEGVMEFGYKYPNRVKYDAIEIPHDQVKKGIAPVELDQIWEYYLRNQHSSEFIKDIAPSTRPEDAFSLQKGPTTRPMTFDEAKEKIITRLTADRVEQLENKIRAAILNTMQADFDAYKSALPAGASTTAPSAKAPDSSLGVPYNSYDYLQKLRDKIQADFKVTVTIEREDAWQTPKSLEASQFGKEMFENDAQTGFAVYISHAVEPFLTEEQKKQLSMSRPENKPIAVWEPTPVFKDTKDNQLILRATAADPSHVPASIDEVKEKVAADVKIKQAFEKARQSAQALLDASKDKWLENVAKAQGKKVFITGLFHPAQAGAPPVTIEGYDIKGPAADTLVAGAFKLLTLPPRSGEAPRIASTQPTTTQPTTKTAAKPATQPTTTPVVTAFKDHPVGLIEVPQDGKILVAEINQLKPIWTKDRQAYWNTGIANQQRVQIEQLLRTSWFKYDNVISRVGYVPTEKRDRKTPVQLPPQNPF